VSKATRVTAQALYKHNVIQVRFKPGPEDCYGRGGSDNIWQTVPDTSSGDGKSKCNRQTGG